MPEKKPQYAQVVFNLPLDHAYTYKLPPEISQLAPGTRVLVPFGKRTITGIVVEMIAETPLTSLKYIIDVLDERPLISPEMMSLTRWIADYYLCGWGQALQLALPKGIDQSKENIVTPAPPENLPELSERQRELYLLIGANPGNTVAYYHKKFGKGSFYYLLNKLVEKGAVVRQERHHAARVRDLYRQFVIVAPDYAQRKHDYEDFMKYIARKPEVDRFMLEHPERPVLMADFLKTLKMASATLQKMAGYGLCRIEKMKLDRKPEFEYTEQAREIRLTDEQEQAIGRILEKVNREEFGTFLLHGITGSGKTQVYIEVLREVLRQGKTAVIMIPEISLTPQTVARFEQVSDGRAVVFNSKMSPGERLDAWNACYDGRAKVVIGPRSALFAPLKNIGLIVIDEEHETTYKQSDTVPRYHARDVAVYWAKMNRAVVVMGSATPSLESYFNARKGKYQLLEIRNRIDNIRLPSVYIVDMKTRRARIGQKPTMFSQVLVDKIKERLERKEQILILQNRRGYSAYMQCKDCGYIPVCPNCDVALTYHSYNEKLQCHLCGHIQPAYRDCPNCGGEQLVYKGIGTQRVESELKQLLPQVRILRMDQDTTRGKNSHDQILSRFMAGEADILLGTQMIAKGLDFGKVTLVGVVSADVGLGVPDFRSPERVFQLLTQVAGRAGRRDENGEVVVQTYLYSHYAIQFARNHDYTGFYMQEIQHRADFGYPPYHRLIQVQISAPKVSDAISTARVLAATIQRRTRKYGQVVGPAPALLVRMNNLYRWQFHIRLNPKSDPTGQHTKQIIRPILEPYLKKNNQDIRVAVDVDPILLV